MKNARSYLHSSIQNNRMWQTDGQKDGQTARAITLIFDEVKAYKRIVPFWGHPVHVEYCAVMAWLTWMSMSWPVGLADEVMRYPSVTFFYLRHHTKCKQVAQLSQRDRAAGWVSYGQKWKTVNGWQHFTDIACLQPLWRNCPAEQSNLVRKRKKGYYAAQGHSRSSR